MHVDVAADDHEGEVERLVELGATRVADVDEWGYRWTVLHDPEGNEFCVVQPGAGPSHTATPAAGDHGR